MSISDSIRSSSISFQKNSNDSPYDTKSKRESLPHLNLHYILSDADREVMPERYYVAMDSANTGKKTASSQGVVKTVLAVIPWMIKKAILQTPSLDPQVGMELEILSGSRELAAFFEAIIPDISKHLLQSLSTAESGMPMMPLILKDGGLVEGFIQVLLPKIYINIAKRIKGDSNRCVSLSDVFSHLLGVIYKHLFYIHSHIKELEALKKEKINLFLPFAKELLSVALPKGANEFPLRGYFKRIMAFFISYSNNIKNLDEAVAWLCIQIYENLTVSSKNDTKSALKQMPKGTTLAALAESISLKAAENVPDLFVWEGNSPPPIVQNILETLTLFSNAKSLKKKTELELWFGKQLSALVCNEDENIQRFRQFVCNYLDPLLTHIFFHLSKQDLPTTGALDCYGTATVKILSLCNDFFNAHNKIISERLHVLKLTNGNPLNDEKLLHYFRTCANQLVIIMKLDTAAALPVPELFKELFHKHLLEQLPIFLLKQYLYITNTPFDIGDAHKKLRRMLFDPKNILDPAITKHVVSILFENSHSISDTMYEEFYNTLWNTSGTERLAETVEAMSAIAAQELVETILNYLGVNAQESLNEDHCPFMKRAKVYLKGLAETMFLEMTAHTIITTKEEIIPPSEMHPKQYLIFNILTRLFNLAEGGLKNIDQKLEDAIDAFGYDPEIYSQEVRSLFIPFVSQLHALGGKNIQKHLPFDALPGGSSFKTTIWNSIKDPLLTNLVSNIYKESTSWHSVIRTSMDDLEKYYRTSHPVWACHLVAQFVSDATRHFLDNSSDEAAKQILGTLQNYLAHSAIRHSDFLNSLVKSQESGIESVLAQNVHLLGSQQDSPFQDVWSAFTSYVESSIAKTFAGLSKTIHDVEMDHPDFMIDLAIKLLKDTAEYFEIINKVTVDLGEEHSYLVPTEVLLASFGSKLHDGVPLKPDGSQDEQERTRLQGHFIPLVSKVMKLASLSIKDLPIPNGLKLKVGELFLNKIIPTSLMKAYRKIFENRTRDSLMLSFIHTLYNALHRIDLPKDEAIELPKTTQNPKQKYLNETCGAVVLQLVKLIPDTMVQYVFMKEKVKNLSAEAIGELIMPILSRWTLLQLIDTTIYNSLPNFHASKWEGKVGREKLVPRMTITAPDGSQEVQIAKKFSFTFPRNAAQLEAEAQSKAIAEARVRTKLRNAFTRTISTQLRTKTWSIIKAFWNDIQNQLNDFIEKQFPEKGPQVKSSLDRVARALFFDFIGPIIEFFLSPIIKLIQFAMEKIYINRRSDEIIANLHSEALEHLLYKWVDSTLDYLIVLKTAAKDQDGGPKESLL